MAVLVETAPKHVASVRELFIDVLSEDQLAQLAQISELIAERVAESG